MKLTIASALSFYWPVILLCVTATGGDSLAAVEATTPVEPDMSELLREIPDGPYVPNVLPGQKSATSPGRRWVRGPFESIQVNVDAAGDNIIDDAANEPSIAIDPTNPNRLVIGWRQFDNIVSNFRQAGVAYSHDGGQTWTADVIDPTVFRSDPVLDAASDGSIYYYSLTMRDDLFVCDLFTSSDGGATWDGGVYAHGGDKEWMVVDRTGGLGDGNIYAAWNLFYSCCDGDFTRSTDGGQTFMEPINIPGSPYWGTLAVGPDGTLYISGDGFTVSRSPLPQEPDATPSFDPVTVVDLGGWLRYLAGPNPGGLLGQAWIAVDHSDGATRGNVYLFASVGPGGTDPLDVIFARSTDGGETWSEPIRVNDDPEDNGAWQWFGTMSVAPNGRIDVIWNDTRNTGVDNLSELFYAFSEDGGLTWSRNTPISPVFDSHVGWPQQNKLGDYYDMISDDAGASIAYAATFNGEQDVYFLRAEPPRVPTVSEWGVVVTALLLLTTGTVLLARRRVCG